jgi:S-adenosylmethionine-diacylglycerol 3-amino-3-carboxypropyl transferase
MSSPKYFSGLNYTLGNEDTGFEVSLVKELKPKHILSIAGCGSRALPLLCAGAETLTCVDIASAQLRLTRLRQACYENLSFEDFLIFWGFPPYAAYDYRNQRRDIFSRLKLDSADQDFFQNIFHAHAWESILYAGKWERTFHVLSKGLRLLLGKDYAKLLSFNNLSEQIDYYENDFPKRRWEAVLFLLGNKPVFNALLYKGDFIKKNVPESHFDYYYQAFDQLFRNSLARTSFFANLCFFGHIQHADGNTIEAQPENYLAVADALANGAKVFTLEQDLLSAAKELKSPCDFVSLSDVPSYFSGELEKNFAQELRPHLSRGAIVVLRSYLRVPQGDWSGYEDVTMRYSTEIAKELVQMYRIQVFQKV